MSCWSLLNAAVSKRKETGRLGGLFIMAVGLALGLVNGSATAEDLWQSPQSPLGDEAQAEPPTATPPPPTAVPTEPLPATEEASLQPAPTEAPATNTPTALPTPTPPPVAPTAPPLPATEEAQAGQFAAPGAEPEPLDLRGQDIPVEADASAERNFILDRIELIDTLAVSGAYVWLCCGVGLLLILPLFLLILYIRGRSRILQEESYY